MNFATVLAIIGSGLVVVSGGKELTGDRVVSMDEVRYTLEVNTTCGLKTPQECKDIEKAHILDCIKTYTYPVCGRPSVLLNLQKKKPVRPLEITVERQSLFFPMFGVPTKIFDIEGKWRIKWEGVSFGLYMGPANMSVNTVEESEHLTNFFGSNFATIGRLEHGYELAVVSRDMEEVLARKSKYEDRYALLQWNAQTAQPTPFRATFSMDPI